MRGFLGRMRTLLGRAGVSWGLGAPPPPRAGTAKPRAVAPSATITVVTLSGAPAKLASRAPTATITYTRIA
jgi:hypothetical protein